MGRNHFILVSSFLVLPIAVEAPSAPPDSSHTRISIAGGIGDYLTVVRGCEGQVLNTERFTFKDIGMMIEHKFANPVKIGVRGGAVGENEGRPFAPKPRRWNAYINPHIALEWRYFGIGAGVLQSQENVYFRSSSSSDGGFGESSLGYSGHLRLGNHDAVHFSMELNEGVPLYSAGGLFAMGIGFRPHANVGVWTGTNVGPFDAFGFAARSEVRVAPSWFLNVAGRIGSVASQTEGSVSLGITYQISGGGDSTDRIPAHPH